MPTRTAKPALRKLSPEREEFRRLFDAGDFARARVLAERMFAAGRERLAWVHNWGSVALEQGNVREAYTLYVTNAHLLEGADDYDVANFHLSFGLACRRLGRTHASPEFYDRALIEYAAAGYHFERAGEDELAAHAANNTAYLLKEIGRPADAHQYAERAQLLFNDLGAAKLVAQVEDTRAQIYEAEGRLDEALECAGRSVVALMRLGEAQALRVSVETMERVLAKVKARALAA